MLSAAVGWVGPAPSIDARASENPNLPKKPRLSFFHKPVQPTIPQACRDGRNSPHRSKNFGRKNRFLFLIIKDLGGTLKEYTMGCISCFRSSMNGFSPNIFEGTFAVKCGNYALKAQNIQSQGETLGFGGHKVFQALKGRDIRSRSLCRALSGLPQILYNQVFFNDNGNQQIEIQTQCFTIRFFSMTMEISKSKFKPNALKYFREVEKPASH